MQRNVTAVQVLCDTAVRMLLIGVGAFFLAPVLLIALVVGAVVLTVALAELGSTNPAALLVLLAMVGAAIVFWRPLYALGRRIDRATAPETERLRERVAALSAQVDSLQREQRHLQAVIRWQEQLLQTLDDDGSFAATRRARR